MLKQSSLLTLGTAVFVVTCLSGPGMAAAKNCKAQAGSASQDLIPEPLWKILDFAKSIITDHSHQVYLAPITMFRKNSSA
jgi:hypothetical protein